MNCSTMTIKVREAVLDDIEDLYIWRNHETTQLMLHNTAPTTASSCSHFRFQLFFKTFLKQTEKSPFFNAQ